MKTINVLLFTLLMVSCTVNYESPDYANWSLLGKVESCTETFYKVDDSNDKFAIGEMAQSGHNTTSFGKDGRYLLTVFTNQAGVAVMNSVPRYENDVVADEMMYAVGSGTSSVVKYIERTEKHRISEVVNAEGQVSQKIITILENYQPVKRQITYLSPIEKVKTIDFEYTAKGFLSKRVEKESIKEESVTTTYEYLEFDENGNWTLAKYRVSDEPNYRPTGYIKRSYNYFKQ